ncbi:MAG: hypothetical protein U0Q22_07510 [Acidimicrobiales bacterium]
MLARVRQLVIDRAFGTGAGGFVAASIVGWLIDQVKAGKQPIRLDTANLEPGETYLVTTRPPMSRAEAKALAKRNKAAAELAKVTRPSRSVRTTARKLAKAERSAAKASAGSKRRARRERDVEVLGAKFDALTTPTAKQVKLEASVAELEARLARHRADALRSAGGARAGKRPRVKVFR